VTVRSWYPLTPTSTTSCASDRFPSATEIENAKWLM
jgi:hypothetical protein